MKTIIIGDPDSENARGLIAMAKSVGDNSIVVISRDTASDEEKSLALPIGLDDICKYAPPSSRSQRRELQRLQKKQQNKKRK